MLTKEEEEEEEEEEAIQQAGFGSGARDIHTFSLYKHRWNGRDSMARDSVAASQSYLR